MTCLELKKLVINIGSKSIGPINSAFSSGRLNLVIGRSGSGKSSLLKTISGFYSDYTGNILYEGAAFEPQGNVALVFQNPESLFFNNSVFNEIGFPLHNSGIDKVDMEVLVNEWMIKWGLEPELFKGKNPFELSGGEKRRVALAACTIMKPKVILLDEPLAGLDYFGQLSLSSIIKSLTEDHVVIVVTHEPELLLNEETSLLYVDDKSIQMSGSEFLARSIENSDFYPLPDWYWKAVSPYSKCDALPLINPESVADFIIKRVKE